MVGEERVENFKTCYPDQGGKMGRWVRERA